MYVDPSGTIHRKGDVVKATSNLTMEFANKFEEVHVPIQHEPPPALPALPAAEPAVMEGPRKGKRPSIKFEDGDE